MMMVLGPLWCQSVGFAEDGFGTSVVSFRQICGVIQATLMMIFLRSVICNAVAFGDDGFWTSVRVHPKLLFLKKSNSGFIVNQPYLTM